MKNHKLILASASPRRSELMQSAGFDFTIKVADIDEEKIPPQVPIVQIPAFLAKEKALKVFDRLEPTEKNDLILAADSLVFCNDIIYSKPKSKAEAISILSALSNKKHTVITGVCLMNQFFQDIVSVSTLVTFEPISLEEMEYYIEIYKPYDKAGAYGIQDWIGLTKVSTIEGSYSNIMGLPMETVYRLLQNRINLL